MPRFHPLPISAVAPTGSDAVAVTFAVPEALRDTFRFLPGQYLTLRADVGGTDLRRSYSICDGGPGHLTVGIKRVADGRFSTWAQNLAPGTALEVLPPEGRFALRPGDGPELLLIAAGSGITPCLAIATEALRDPARRITLLYGNRSTADVMFKRDVEALKDAYPDRVQIIHILSREAQDVPLFSGRIDGARIADLVRLGLIDPERTDAAFLDRKSVL